MSYYDRYNTRLMAYSMNGDPAARNINLAELSVPAGYQAEVFATGLDCPIGMVFNDNGDLFIADSGINSGIGKIIRLSNGIFEVLAQNFNVPITGINIIDSNIYVSHRGYITVLRSNGESQHIISGLPCNGDYGLSNVAFGPEGKIYFGLGTVTNSGVVGKDNPWVFDHPFLHDNPAFDIILNGQNYVSNNFFVLANETAYTGAFAPYGISNMQYEIKRGSIKASGSILRANRDGSDLELVAWGFRNPVHLSFDREYQLFAANRGYDVRGSRPIANAPDEFHQVTEGIWYGWPDYSAGESVTLPKFRPEGGAQPENLFAEHPNVPPVPFAKFTPHVSILGFDFNYYNDFGNYGDAFIAEYGSYGSATLGAAAPYEGIGHRVSRIDMNTGDVSTFLSNKSGLPAYISGRGGFGRPVDIIFGPDHAMYILDFGLSDRRNPWQPIPNTGVIWRVSRQA